MRGTRPKLFEDALAMPAGFRYVPELLAAQEEQRLLREFEPLDFKPFDFRGFKGKRRVVSFGWRYDFGGRGLTRVEQEIPDFVLPVRERAAAAFDLPAAELQQVSIIEYPPAATIGWHRDRAVFGHVIGISVGSACIFRFRRKAGDGWERRSLVLEPRSAYVLQGEARSAWEHSIPEVPSLRYSITLRNLR